MLETINSPLHLLQSTLSKERGYQEKFTNRVHCFGLMGDMHVFSTCKTSSKELVWIELPPEVIWLNAELIGIKINAQSV